MTDLYQFLTGPGLWITFTVFIGGMLVRLVFLYGLSRGRDKVMYNHADAGWAMKSIMHWLLPWTNASTRSQPVFAGVFYLFHICILAVPLFLAAHNLMWDEAFGISLWSMPDKVADWLTLVVIACGVFLIARRIYRPEVRILTTAWDYFLILLTMAPFVTGYLAYHQYGDYGAMLILHIICSEVLLMVIPFSKLGHMVLFFFSRAAVGFELGGRRDCRAW